MRVPLPSDVVLWRLHLQLICSLSLFLSCLFLFRQPCKLSSISCLPLVWSIFVFDWYAFESSFKLVNSLNLSKNWFRTVCTVYQISSINFVPHVADTIENVLWSSFYCPTYQCDKLCLPCCGYNRERSMKFLLLPTYQFTTDILNSETE